MGVPGVSVVNVVKGKTFGRRKASNREVSFRCSLFPREFATEGMRVTDAGMATVLPMVFTPPKGGKVGPVELLVEVGGGTIDEWNTWHLWSLPVRPFVASSLVTEVRTSVVPAVPLKTSFSAKYFLCRQTRLGAEVAEVTLLAGGPMAFFMVRVSGNFASLPLTSFSAVLPLCSPSLTVCDPSCSPFPSSGLRREGAYRPMLLFAVANDNVTVNMSPVSIVYRSCRSPVYPGAVSFASAYYSL